MLRAALMAVYEKVSIRKSKGGGTESTEHPNDGQLLGAEWIINT